MGLHAQSPCSCPLRFPTAPRHDGLPKTKGFPRSNKGDLPRRITCLSGWAAASMAPAVPSDLAPLVATVAGLPLRQGAGQPGRRLAILPATVAGARRKRVPLGPVRLALVVAQPCASPRLVLKDPHEKRTSDSEEFQGSRKVFQGCPTSDGLRQSLSRATVKWRRYRGCLLPAPNRRGLHAGPCTTWWCCSEPLVRTCSCAGG